MDLQNLLTQKITLNTEDTKDVKGKEFLNQKNKRRSKKDKTGRNFICGCGKEYLSYPALYTHIKTKHDGVNPQGTVSNQATKTKRGRPKKNESRMDDKRSIPDTRDLEFNFQTSQIKIDPVIALADYIEKTDLRLLKEYSYLEGSTDPSKGFPVVKFSDGDVPVYHPFHAYILELNSHKRHDGLITNNSCDCVFAKFLYAVSKIVNEKFYLVLGLFFRNLRECLNAHGYEKISEFFDRHYTEESKSLIPKRKEDKAFCERETPEFLPFIADKFIVEYLPKYCPDFDQQLGVDLMFDLCNWLLKKKLTKIRTGFNNGGDSVVIITEEEEENKKIKETKKMFGKLR